MWIKAIIFTLIVISKTAYAQNYYAESEWGNVILSDEKCWFGQYGLHAVILSGKDSPKTSVVGCWEEKDGYVYLNWNRSIGNDGSFLEIDTLQRIVAPASLRAASKNKKTVNQVNKSSGSVEILELIDGFMLKPDEKPSWIIGVNEKIKWKSKGIEKKCGVYASCKHGKARILIGGVELQNAKTPVLWDIFIHSYKNSNYEPEEVEVTPKCETVQCSFSFDEEEIRASGINVQKLCHAGPGGGNTTGYLLKNNDRQLFVAYNSNEGSGGSSNSLTLRWRSSSNEELCADAKLNE